MTDGDQFEPGVTVDMQYPGVLTAMGGGRYQLRQLLEERGGRRLHQPRSCSQAGHVADRRIRVVPDDLVPGAAQPLAQANIDRAIELIRDLEHVSDRSAAI